MDQLSPAFILSAASTIVTALGFFFGLRYKLDMASAKVDAVHKRLDEIEVDFHKLDKVVDRHDTYISDLRQFKHKEGDTMNAFKMAKELLQEEREDRG